MRAVAIAIAGLALALSSTTAYSQTVSKEIAAAVADKNRPEADTTRDADRKPAEVIAFAGIKPGDKVVDLLPGGGYFTRIFAKTVGPKGHVYAVNPGRPAPPAGTPAQPPRPNPVEAFAAEYGNITVESPPAGEFKIPSGVDVAWTSLNYHDLKNPGRGMDMAAFNKAIFAGLKPGGTYIVIDHIGKGDGAIALHRIDPAVVKQEVTAAGFTFAGESKVLLHPDDNPESKLTDAGRGKTNQFVYKFTKK